MLLLRNFSGQTMTQVCEMCLKVLVAWMWFIRGINADHYRVAPPKEGGCERCSEEEKLLEYLFRRYNPSARPVINSNQTVPVKIQFSLMHIQELDVKSQILTATGLLILEWTDERLRWDPEVYHLSEVVVEARQLWVPEFAVINGAEEIYGDYREFRAIITCDGVVHWEPGGVFRTMCEIDITYFPFDDQKCALVFGAWSYHTTKMNLTNTADTVNLDSYEKNGEWEIISTEVIRDEFAYECCPRERFSNVAFVVHMRRRYTFYVMNVILPSMVTSVLLLSIFYCPPGQKVQIGVVVLLSFRIFLLNVTDSIPKTSDHIPLLGIYLTCTMAITTLSMVLTVLVLNLHSISERPVPKWLRILVIHYMARLFCRWDAATQSAAKYETHLHMRKKRKTQYTVAMTEEETDEVPIIALNGAVSVPLGQESPLGPYGVGRAVGAETNGSPACTGSPAYRRSRPRHSIEVPSSTPAPDYGKEWQILAEVVDRLFFWTFLLAIVAISLLLFHPLTKSFFTRELNAS